MTILTRNSIKGFEGDFGGGSGDWVRKSQRQVSAVAVHDQSPGAINHVGPRPFDLSPSFKRFVADPLPFVNRLLISV